MELKSVTALKCVLFAWLFQVFEAVIAWVNHDKDVRQEHLAQLMEHVRLPLLSREYLVQVSVCGRQRHFFDDCYLIAALPALQTPCMPFAGDLLASCSSVNVTYM